MRKDLRDIAVDSAAARYGSEHYRLILFMISVGKYWWVAIIPAAVAALWWASTHLSRPDNSLIGFAVAGVSVLALLMLAVVRRIRSPYRRRRF